MSNQQQIPEHHTFTYPELVLIVAHEKTKHRKMSTTSTVSESMLLNCPFSTAMAEHVFDLLDVDHTGQITTQAMSQARKNSAVTEYLALVKCKHISELFAPRYFQPVVEKLIKGKQRVITRVEWVELINKTREQRLGYFKQLQLLHQRSYWGLGEVETTDPTKIGCWTIHPLWYDFIYYSLNNHPLLWLVFADRCHPVKRSQRLVQLFAHLGWLFLLSGIIVRGRCNNLPLRSTDTSNCEAYTTAQTFVVTFLWVTLPTIALRGILRYLTANQKCLADASKASMLQQCSIFFCKQAGSGCAFCIAFLMVFFWVFGGIVWKQNGLHQLWLWVLSLFYDWILWFIQTLFSVFLPYWCFKRPFQCLGVSFATWQFERRITRAILRQLVEEAGDSWGPARPDIARPVTFWANDATSGVTEAENIL